MRTKSVTTLKREATKLLSELERYKQQILIAERRLPRAHLVDVERYELLQQRIVLLEGTARGELAIAEGRVVSHAKAKTRMAQWLEQIPHSTHLLR